MKRILKLIPRIAIAVVALVFLGVNLAGVYILFAPDSMPKPFYLQWDMAPDSGSETSEGNPSSSSESENPSEGQEPGENSEGLSANLDLKPGQGIMLDTGAKIVNIDPSGRKLLRVSIVLEFASHEFEYYTLTGEEKQVYEETFKEELGVILPVINDVLISMLSDKTFEELYTADAKESLRHEILETVNRQLPEYNVLFVYFTEFVVQ